jgi:hypothetical protein
MISLVYLKTTCLAYNASPVEVIKLREQGRDFNQIVWVHRSEGRHIKTARGREVREPPDKVKIRPMEHNKPGHDKDKPETEPEKGKPGLRSGAGDMIGGKDEQPKADEKPKTDKNKPKTDPKPSKDKGKPKGSDKSKTDDKGGKDKK